MSDEEDAPDLDVCAICCDAMDGEATTCLNGCLHKFHTECIVASLQWDRRCPLCRYAPVAEVPPPSPSEPSFSDDEIGQALRQVNTMKRKMQTLLRRYKREPSRFSRREQKIMDKYMELKEKRQHSEREVRSKKMEVDDELRTFRRAERHLDRRHLPSIRKKRQKLYAERNKMTKLREKENDVMWRIFESFV